MSQVSGWVPCAVPSPWQVLHTTAVGNVMSLVTPNAVSSRSSSTRTLMLRPRRIRSRAARVPVLPPKNAFIKSSNGKPAPKPVAPPPAAPPRANGSTPMSYMRRFSGLESTS